MSEPIPSLRAALDAFPSPLEDHPGVLLRDPLGYADGMLAIPPLLARGMAFFDGAHTVEELSSHFVRLTGDPRGAEAARSMVAQLRERGFLDSPEFEARRALRHRNFSDAPVRPPAHAGSAYPEDPAAARAQLEEWTAAERTGSAAEMTGDAAETTGTTTADSIGTANAGAAASCLVGIAAPHVSPGGGFRSYAAAYSQLGPEDAERTFVVLGTSHHGEPDRFGITRKPFVTPLGTAEVDRALVDEIEFRAADAVVPEDYCHAMEHSIEFQVLFLSHVLGRAPRIVPILVGPFLRALTEGGRPEEDPAIERTFDLLREIRLREWSRLCWVLGVDLAHIGRRYGDPEPARADEGRMEDVASEDRARLALLARGDADGFLDLALPEQDPLRWCGLSPLYTFARVAPEARGEVLRYEQWNIDEGSVVTFAGLSFRCGSKN